MLDYILILNFFIILAILNQKNLILELTSIVTLIIYTQFYTSY